MNKGTVITSGPLQGTQRNYARKLSAFNLTDAELKNKDLNYVELYEQTPKQGAVFVDYPTQAGSFYQWGINKTDNTFLNYFRRAYHPAQPDDESSPTGYWVNDQSMNKIPLWASSGTGAPTEYEYGYGNEFEVCPPGYHRPTDGYTDRISYNGLYPNYKWNGSYVDVDGNVVAQTDGSANISFSEWRQSLWMNPWPGESVPGTENVVVGQGTAKQKTAIRTRTSPVYQENKDIFLLFGFYADGYYDRRPMKVQMSTTSSTRVSVGVSVNSPNVAYRGTVVYNPESNASNFFPASGRRRDRGGWLEYAGETAYYWSSSTSPTTPTWDGDVVRAVWAIEIGGWAPGHLHTLPTFGHSVRCVKDEISSN